VKNHQNHCIYIGLATFGRPLSDTFAIKTAIVERTINFPSQNGDNVGQVVPNVAQVSQNGPPWGGSAKSLFLRRLRFKTHLLRSGHPILLEVDYIAPGTPRHPWLPKASQSAPKAAQVVPPIAVTTAAESA
jgi:hypothetical protein